jgi:heterodisulfide reductase subunit A
LIRVKESVLVLGGGIAGLQVANDLAGLGFHVYLVERSPSIGGRMAQLDKTFPTNDCSMCILAPKMIDCASNPEITLWTCSEMLELEGDAGSFKATIKRNPRYVKEELCVGCMDCVEGCVYKRPKFANEFDMGMAKRKPVYRPFPQAVPSVALIDPKTCIELKTGNCKKTCIEACDRNAIDLEQKEEIVEVEVGAVVLATGFDPMDTSTIKEYGAGRIANVVSGLEFERLLSASGPTEGHVLRPADGKAPKKIAFIQCVGSRDVRNYAYCSAVCCMHATKEAILANEHDREVTSAIFYTDLRAAGKTFQKYVTRAKTDYAVSYIRSRPGLVEEDGETGDVRVVYEDTNTREKRIETFDMVVLCQALIAASASDMSGMLGVELDDHGFVRIEDELAAPVDTSRPGILAVGFATGPKDIPDSVVQASAAAGRVAEMLRG